MSRLTGARSAKATSASTTSAPRIAHDHIVAFVDRALRPDATISVADDLPFLFDAGAPTLRRCVVRNGNILAHAAAYRMTAHLDDVAVPMAVIGAVATHADHRRQGLGHAVVDALCDDLQRVGTAVAILWADVGGFYERLGFSPFGSEMLFHCRRGRLPSSKSGAVRAASADDLAAMTRLHERERGRVERDAAMWQRVFGMPGTEFFVLEENAAVVAYGVLGKGHDLQGCIHEWGGDELRLPQLVRGMMDATSRDTAVVMAAPWKEQARSAMAFHSVEAWAGALGMGRLLKRDVLLAGLGGLPRDAAAQDDATLLRTVFGSSGAVEAFWVPSCAGESLPTAAPTSALPLPFYAFGLDSA